MNAHVLISQSCVNDCVFCAVADKRRSGLFPSKDDIVGFIRDSVRAGEDGLNFSGLGEPTLDPFFEDYLRTAKEAGYGSIGVFTNGHGIDTEKVRKWKSMGLSAALISLHGLERGHDASVRRDGSFKDGLKALELYTREGFAVSVNTCLTRINIEEIESLCSLVDGYPVRSHSLSFPEWSGNALLNPEALIDYVDLIPLAERLAKTDFSHRFFSNAPPCLVGSRVDVSRSSISYLDGNGKRIVSPRDCNAMDSACAMCSQKLRCPGIDRNYIQFRGRNRAPPFILDTYKKKELFMEEHQAVRGHGSVSGHGASGAKLCVIIKPTSRCNAACAYCSNARHAPTLDMTVELYGKIARAVSAEAKRRGTGQVCILWHGGEPLLMGKEFFRQVLEGTPSVDGIRLNHAIQTNLLLFDEDWASLFREHAVPVSTSVDPFDDGLRIMADGTPQFGMWMERFRIAAEGKLRLGAVFTATKAHKGKAVEVYWFLRNLSVLVPTGFGTRVNAVYPEGAAAESSYGNLLTAEEHLRFFSDLAAAWDGDGRSFPLSPFSELASHAPLACEQDGQCWENFIGIDGQGRISACGRMLDVGVFWGELGEDGLGSVVTSEICGRPGKRNDALSSGACAACIAWDICHGGCPGVVEAFSGDALDPHMYCRTMREVLLPIYRSRK